MQEMIGLILAFRDEKVSPSLARKLIIRLYTDDLLGIGQQEIDRKLFRAYQEIKAAYNNSCAVYALGVLGLND